MKHRTLFLFAMLATFVFSSFHSRKIQTKITQATTSIDEAYYAFVTTSTPTLDKKSYVSSIIYYPGYPVCNTRSSLFERDARHEFQKHLNATYTDFRNGGSNYIICRTARYKGSHDFKTRKQAEVAMNEWITKEHKAGNKVIVTAFAFLCQRDKH